MAKKKPGRSRKAGTDSQAEFRVEELEQAYNRLGNWRALVMSEMEDGRPLAEEYVLIIEGFFETWGELAATNQARRAPQGPAEEVVSCISGLRDAITPKLRAGEPLTDDEALIIEELFDDMAELLWGLYERAANNARSDRREPPTTGRLDGLRNEQDKIRTHLSRRLEGMADRLAAIPADRLSGYLGAMMEAHIVRGTIPLAFEDYSKNGPPTDWFKRECDPDELPTGLKDRFQPGDSVFFWSSDVYPDRAIESWQGYVIVRGGGVVGHEVVSFNSNK